MKASTYCSTILADNPLQVAFLALLPRIRTHGRVFFRHLKCLDKREDAIAEMVALCWRSFVRLVRRGKDPAQFPSALASYAARAVRNGRRLAGMNRPKDVLSPLAQQRHEFAVQSIPDGSSLMGNVFAEALTDNTQSPVFEQVSFRLDFPAWLRMRCERDRRVVQDDPAERDQAKSSQA